MATLKRAEVEKFGYVPDVVALLGVSTLPGVGAATIKKLGNASFIKDLLASESVKDFSSLLNSSGAKFSNVSVGSATWDGLKAIIWRTGLEAVADLMERGIGCVTPDSPFYPEQLNDLGNRRPNWLFLRGNIELLQQRSIAVVGTREASDAGDFLTKYAVSVCRAHNLPVVSGLAKGIDTIAHEWSLRLGLPTISILGSGILCPYPARNAGLADAIVKEGGLLVSEYLPLQSPTAESFVWRNRLQACISDCVIATEWRRSSGTAHTVRFAAELGRGSISLSLCGKEDKPDAGRGRRHFVVPNEHFGFCEEILSGSRFSFGLTEERGPAADSLKVDVDVKKDIAEVDLGYQPSLF